jgi:hypothetical protein
MKPSTQETNNNTTSTIQKLPKRKLGTRTTTNNKQRNTKTNRQNNLHKNSFIQGATLYELEEAIARPGVTKTSYNKEGTGHRGVPPRTTTSIAESALRKDVETPNLGIHLACAPQHAHAIITSRSNNAAQTLRSLPMADSLSLTQVRAALQRAITKLARQEQAVGATRAEIQVWEQYIKDVEKKGTK